MRFIILTLTIFFLTTSLSFAQTAVTGRNLAVNLSADHVDISIGFNGADLSLFGVKNQPGQLAVIVRGPEQTTVVRRKGRRLGLWMNTESVEFLNVPVYYDFAVSVPEEDLAPAEVLRKYNIGLDALNIHVEKNEDAATLDSFREALVRNLQTSGHFPLSPKPVTFISDDFFRVDFHVPADVPTGVYMVETILFKDRKIIDRRETRLRVAQVGFSADVHNFAYDRGFLYGLLAVGLALIFGVSGHFFFRRTA